MYYPYLRGKQYEIIALKELEENKLISDKIVPVVEPIKASPTLLSFMRFYKEKNINFGIVLNPEHGSFINEINDSDMKEYKENIYSLLNDTQCCLPVLILNRKDIETNLTNNEKASLAVCNNVDIVKFIPELEKKHNISRFMIPDERIFKRGIIGEKILMADNFKKQPRNADYLKSTDDFFSEDHMYFEKEGYIGFSDFSIIGKDFIDSGFAPFAVAIHMVYFDDDNRLRVYHFVSDSNDDYDDPAGKFGEALGKLMKSSKIDKSTYAYNEFKKLHDNQIYSGLGIIKKLSIMHHLEIVSKFLLE